MEKTLEKSEGDLGFKLALTSENWYTKLSYNAKNDKNGEFVFAIIIARWFHLNEFVTTKFQKTFINSTLAVMVRIQKFKHFW